MSAVTAALTLLLLLPPVSLGVLFPPDLYLNEAKSSGIGVKLAPAQVCFWPDFPTTQEVLGG